MTTRKTIKANSTEKFLCLVYFEPTIFDRMTPAEFKAMQRDSLDYDRALTKSGHMVHAEALQSFDMATCVRVRKGKVATTDGPFAETKEVLGGFILIHARNRKEAQKVAAGIPLAKYGTIEVRPIYAMR